LQAKKYCVPQGEQKKAGGLHPLLSSAEELSYCIGKPLVYKTKWKKMINSALERAMGKGVRSFEDAGLEETPH